MTATLVAQGLAGGYGHRTLFDSLDVTVAPGDVVGVVGANGAGKSTLLRLLAGVDEPQAGTIALAPSDAFVGWLPQEHERVPGETVAEYIARRTGCAEATREMDAAAAGPRRPVAERATAPIRRTSTRRRSIAGWPAAPPTSMSDSRSCSPISGSISAGRRPSRPP